MKLEEVILEQKDQEQDLFMAAEQESGSGRNHVQVIINLKMQCKAKQWLAEEYPKVIFRNQHNHRTSINQETYQRKKKYDDDLKEFL